MQNGDDLDIHSEGDWDTIARTDHTRADTAYRFCAAFAAVRQDSGDRHSDRFTDLLSYPGNSGADTHSSADSLSHCASHSKSYHSASHSNAGTDAFSHDAISNSSPNYEIPNARPNEEADPTSDASANQVSNM